MKVKLKTIASIQMGHSFRSRLEPEPNGNVSVIQMKDLTDNNELDNQSLVHINMDNLKGHHRVKQNDLAFRSRGLTNTAAIIKTEINTAVIAAPLLRIRVNNDGLLPEYLCWHINQPLSQSELQSKATGTNIKMISKPALEELVIILPNIETQKQIVALDKLSANEHRLMQVLSEKKRKLMEGTLMQLATGKQLIRKNKFEKNQ